MSDFIYITVIADYNDDNAFARVSEELHAKLLAAGTPFDHIKIDERSVPPFDTNATGFDLAEQARNSRLGAQDGIRRIFYVNTAPRCPKHLQGKDLANNAGEDLIYAKLTNGVEILGVNSGNAFAFLDGAVQEAYSLDIANYGSQFRSLHVFPDALRRLVQGDATLFKDAIALPAYPQGNQVVRTDGYGNIKLLSAIPPEQLATLIGEEIHVHLAGITQTATLTADMFDAPEVGLVLSRGSSGWEDNNAPHFIQLSCFQGSAAELFGGRQAVCGGAKLTFSLPEMDHLPAQVGVGIQAHA